MNDLPKISKSRVSCDFCTSEKPFIQIKGMRYGMGGTVDICDKCAKHIVEELKLRLTNKLLGIDE